jgi:hypothetical protein
VRVPTMRQALEEPGVGRSPSEGARRTQPANADRRTRSALDVMRPFVDPWTLDWHYDPAAKRGDSPQHSERASTSFGIALPNKPSLPSPCSAVARPSRVTRTAHLRSDRPDPCARKLPSWNTPDATRAGGT